MSATIYDGFISPEATPVTHELADKVVELRRKHFKEDGTIDLLEAIELVDAEISALVVALGKVELAARTATN